MSRIPNVLAVAGPLLLSVPAHAYEYSTCAGSISKWAGGSTVYFQPASFTFTPGSPFTSAIEAIRTTWNRAPGSNFRFEYSYSDATSFSVNDGRNSIWVNSLYPFSSTQLAVTQIRRAPCVWPPGPTGVLKEADVYFNPAISWDHSLNPSPDNTMTSSLLVGLHELGHAVGFEHEDDLLATMNATYPQGGVLGDRNTPQPHSDDVHGIRAMYGTSGPARDLVASMYERPPGGGATPIISSERTLYRGNTASFRITLENRGTVQESYVPVKFYLSTDLQITTSDFELGSSAFSFSPGAVGTFTVNLTLPTTLSPGYYYFGYIIDPDDNIVEIDSTNNAAAQYLSIYVQ